LDVGQSGHAACADWTADIQAIFYFGTPPESDVSPAPTNSHFRSTVAAVAFDNSTNAIRVQLAVQRIRQMTPIDLFGIIMRTGARESGATRAHLSRTQNEAGISLPQGSGGAWETLIPKNNNKRRSRP
jgi:hypothetical protein